MNVHGSGGCPSTHSPCPAAHGHTLYLAWRAVRGSRGTCLCLILPLPPSHISQVMLPVASPSPFTTTDGCWELGLDIQAVMVKLVGIMVTKVPDTVTYAKFKAWLSAVEDWVASHLGTALKVLGPHAVRMVARVTMMIKLYAILDTTGMLGMQKGGGRPPPPQGNMTW